MDKKQNNDEITKRDYRIAVRGIIEALGRLSKELQLKLGDVEKAAKTFPEIPQPNISIKAPIVKVDAPNLKGIEVLLSKELPKLLKQLTDSIPETPETDLSGVEKALEKLLYTMAEVRDRKIPVPQMPTTLKVTNPNGTPVGSEALPLSTTPLVGQAVISTTGTAVNLESGSSQALLNGLIVTANANNVADVCLGTFDVENITNGAGNGYVLQPGASISFALANSDELWVTGTANDSISWAGS